MRGESVPVPARLRRSGLGEGALLGERLVARALQLGLLVDAVGHLDEGALHVLGGQAGRL